jgi:hypothetical protein
LDIVDRYALDRSRFDLFGFRDDVTPSFSSLLIGYNLLSVLFTSLNIRSYIRPAATQHPKRQRATGAKKQKQ